MGSLSENLFKLTQRILYSSVKYGKDPTEKLKWHGPNQVLSYVAARQGDLITYSRNTFKTVMGKKVRSKMNLLPCTKTL